MSMSKSKGFSTKSISRSTVRKATMNIVKSSRSSGTSLRLTPGQRKHITKSH